MTKPNRLVSAGVVTLAATAPFFHTAVYCNTRELCRVETPVLPDEPAEQHPVGGAPRAMIISVASSTGTLTPSGSVNSILR